MNGWLVLALVVLAGGWVAYSYNRFVAQRTSIDASWAHVEVELQRRHDLVPRLVETASGYARHEQRTFAQVTAARAEALAAADLPDQARAEDHLTEGLTGLFALTEAYPQLRADAVFRDLGRELIEAEDRLAAARRLYNLEVAAYERRRASVPSSLIAGGFDFPPRRSFEVLDAAARHAEQVAIDRPAGR